jgi:methylthioribose-1-phosphate isomerase
MNLMRTVYWNPEGPSVDMIDQRLLPGEFKIIHLSTYKEVAQAITDMAIRGAPAIGAAAAFGLALAAASSRASDTSALLYDLEEAAGILRATRPTAVNLGWAIDRLLNSISAAKAHDPKQIRGLLIDKARELADEDVEINKRMGEHGSTLLPDEATVIHHCNTGALATVDYGTALGVIRTAHEKGKNIHVLVDETRPRLQGARLTAWELEQYGIPYKIITDSAAGFFLASGTVHAVLVGADRVAANGDVVNKIGTYMLALAARNNNVPFYSVFPTSTIDLAVSTGKEIPIEERNPSEVLNLQLNCQPVAPFRSQARNPAFDITPHRLISALVTEVGILYPPYKIKLREAVERAKKP